jgi:hypothetical protein
MSDSGYPATWRGSANPEDMSGTITWMVEGEKYEFRLESFEDCQKIDTMLDAVQKTARLNGAYGVYSAVTNAVCKAATEAHIPPEWMKKQ